MSAAFISATVAGIAVVVSAVLQYLTLRRNRENTLLALKEARETARMSTLASLTEQWEHGLIGDLAEFVTMTYAIESGFREAMAKTLPWPGDELETVHQAEVLFARIMLRLDTSVLPERLLSESLNDLKAPKSNDLWIERRDRAISAASRVLAARRLTLWVTRRTRKSSCRRPDRRPNSSWSASIRCHRPCSLPTACWRQTAARRWHRQTGSAPRAATYVAPRGRRPWRIKTGHWQQGLAIARAD